MKISVVALIVLALVAFGEAFLLHPAGRYQFAHVQGAPLMRMDTRTGEMAVLKDGSWQPLLTGGK